MSNCNLEPSREMPLLAGIQENLYSCYIRNHKVVTLTMHFLAYILPWLLIPLYILSYCDHHVALLFHRMPSLWLEKKKKHKCATFLKSYINRPVISAQVAFPKPFLLCHVVANCRKVMSLKPKGICSQHITHNSCQMLMTCLKMKQLIK